MYVFYRKITSKSIVILYGPSGSARMSRIAAGIGMDATERVGVVFRPNDSCEDMFIKTARRNFPVKYDIVNNKKTKYSMRSKEAKTSTRSAYTTVAYFYHWKFSGLYVSSPVGKFVINNESLKPIHDKMLLYLPERLYTTENSGLLYFNAEEFLKDFKDDYRKVSKMVDTVDLDVSDYAFCINLIGTVDTILYAVEHIDELKKEYENGRGKR